MSLKEKIKERICRKWEYSDNIPPHFRFIPPIVMDVFGWGLILFFPFGIIYKFFA